MKGTSFTKPVPAASVHTALESGFYPLSASGTRLLMIVSLPVCTTKCFSLILHVDPSVTSETTDWGLLHEANSSFGPPPPASPASSLRAPVPQRKPKSNLEVVQ